VIAEKRKLFFSIMTLTSSQATASSLTAYESAGQARDGVVEGVDKCFVLKAQNACDSGK
jgi:hypothetical protein